MKFDRRVGIAPALIAVIVVVIIVVGVGVYYVASSSSSSPTTTAQSTTTSTSATQTTTSSTAVATTSQTSSTTTPTSTSTSTPTTTSATQTTTSATQTTTSSTVSTTSSSSSSTTPTSTTSSYSTYTCSSTSTSTTGTTVDYTPQYIALIAQFSSIRFEINGTSNGTPESVTLGYTRTTVSSGIYNATLQISSTSGNESSSFIVDANNNTVLSASIGGFALPKADVKSTFDELMSIYGLQEYFTGEINVFTDSAYFTNQGTSSKTFGTVTFDVTTWVANSLPETVDYCGVSSTINAYTLQVGTPPGTSLLFITYLHFDGTSQGTTDDITFQLLSMTVG